MSRLPTSLGLLALTLAACTLDSTNPSGSGAGGATTGATSGATQPTTGASMQQTSTAGVGGTGVTSTTGANTTSSSSDAASTGMSSTSSGMVTDVPFCTAIKDDFEAYSVDFDPNPGNTTTFFGMGEFNGPWAEVGSKLDSVRWLNDALGKHVKTKFESNKAAALYLKNKLNLGTSNECAVTARLVKVNNNTSAFGMINDVLNPTASARIECEAGGGDCTNLKAWGFNGPQTNVPVRLAILVKLNMVYAFYDDGNGWVPHPAGGQTASTLLGGSLTVGMAQQTGDAESDWDDFNITPLTSDLVPP
ncbi:MAG: hypothetical protein U0414_24295 [Polyangiaceae bacterium]